jgi:hypothetical protein
MGVHGRVWRALVWFIVVFVATLSARYVRAEDTTSPATKPASPDAAYYVIPIKDEVAEGISDAFAKALDAARAAKATHVLLVLDTPGGLVAEMHAMLELMAAAPEFHFVALVHNAGSAGAVLAMSCPDVVITPSGAMGAAAMVGLPRDEILRMKMESYNAAKVRAAVEAAGHEVLLARGMMEPGLEIVAITGRDGQRRIVNAQEARKNAKAHGKNFKLADGASMKTLKAKGTLISLAPEEAVNLGVARGILQTGQRARSSDTTFPLDDIAPLIGLSSWKQVGTAEPMMRKFRANVARENYLAEHKHELDQLDAKIKSLQQNANGLQSQINEQQVNIEQLPNSARPSAQARIGSLQDRLSETLGEINTLTRRRKEILAGPPKK